MCVLAHAQYEIVPEFFCRCYQVAPELSSELLEAYFLAVRIVGF